MHHNKAIIIGSGIAGLASAIRLAVAGMKVDVYERNALPGGKLSYFEKAGYCFDAGPSLFTQPANIEELFTLAGESLSEYLQYEPVSISCKYFYENGTIINAYTNKESFSEELLNKTGEPKEPVIRYLNRSESLYNDTGTVFLNNSLHKRSTWFHSRIFKVFRSLRFSYLFRSLASYNNTIFKQPEVKQLFNRFATYNGSNPYKAPAMLSLIPHLELNEGTFYPAGGMKSITDALYRLAIKKGVTFYFNTTVEKIIHTEAKVKGVVVNHENIPADIVISNADAYFTFNELLGNHVRAKKLLKKARSSSAILFYWGIKKLHPQLELHNIFFSNNYKEEFNCIANKTISADPTIYVNITSKMEAGHAPSGHENWFVMINVPPNTGQDWEILKRESRKKIIDKINRVLATDIEPLIEFEESMDPVMLEEKTGSFMGALYGASSNSKMAAFSRPPNFTSFAKGLYLCGGTVHPGGGIPLCLKSAKITADIILRDCKSGHK
ncbi:MAG: 1-hydroxycarotenoid 3,4-desaturase CrtD [Ferruginibacter sp.]